MFALFILLIYPSRGVVVSCRSNGHSPLPVSDRGLRVRRLAQQPYLLRWKVPLLQTKVCVWCCCFVSLVCAVICCAWICLLFDIVICHYCRIDFDLFVVLVVVCSETEASDITVSADDPMSSTPHSLVLVLFLLCR